MKSGAFMELISYHYYDIISLFKARSHNINITFDEDAFGEAFIKCFQKFKDDIISYDTAIKYFWVAYVNTVKSTLLNSSNHEIIPITDIEEHIEFIDTEYSVDIYNKVMDIIETKYGETDMMIYNLYKYHNWSEDDLKLAGYNCDNIKEKVKEIHKYIKSYCKEHKKSL